MRVAYVSGPYRGITHYDIELNIREAEEAAIALWEMGYSVICPHKNTAHFDGLLDSEETWLEGDLELIDRLIPGKDVIVMLPKWRESEGARAEGQRAIERGLKILFYPQDRKILEALAKIESEQRRA